MKKFSLYGFDAFIDIKDEKLQFLRPILEQWAKINRDYTEQSRIADERDEGNYYWFTERANLSALAGAIWRCGGFAAEEYSARKGDEKSHGRVDLFFKFAGKNIVCEAKHDWLYFPNAKTDVTPTRLVNCLNSALEDVEHTLKANSCDFGLALAFITPYWDYTKQQDPNTKNCRPDQTIDKFQQTFEENMYDELGASFYVYLEDRTNTPIVTGTHNNEAYSTIILIGKIAE